MKNQRGRPKKPNNRNTSLGVRFSAPELEELDRLRGQSKRAQFIRRCVLKTPERVALSKLEQELFHLLTSPIQELEEALRQLDANAPLARGMVTSALRELQVVRLKLIEK